MKTVTKKRGYSEFELRCISCTTVDAICAMSLLLVNGARLFNRYIPECTDRLGKWIDHLFELMDLYVCIPLLYEESNESKAEFMWRMAIHNTQRCINMVEKYDGMERYTDFTLTYLDRLTYRMYKMIGEIWCVCCNHFYSINLHTL